MACSQHRGRLGDGRAERNDLHEKGSHDRFGLFQPAGTRWPDESLGIRGGRDYQLVARMGQQRRGGSRVQPVVRVEQRNQDAGVDDGQRHSSRRWSRYPGS